MDVNVAGLHVYSTDLRMQSGELPYCRIAMRGRLDYYKGHSSFSLSRGDGGAVGRRSLPDYL